MDKLKSIIMKDGVYCRTCGGAGTVGSGPEPEDYGPCPDCSGWIDSEDRCPRCKSDRQALCGRRCRKNPHEWHYKNPTKTRPRKDTPGEVEAMLEARLKWAESKGFTNVTWIKGVSASEGFCAGWKAARQELETIITALKATVQNYEEEMREAVETLVKLKGDIETHRVWTGQEYHQHPVPVYRAKRMLRRIEKVLAKQEETHG